MKNVACQISKQRRSQNPTVSPEGTPVLPWWLSWLRVCLQCRRPRFYPWVGKNPCRREWQPTPVFLPGKFQGQRSLVGYCPWGHKESDTTEQLHFTSLHFIPPKSWPVEFFLGPLTLQPPLGGSHWFLWPQYYQCTDVFKICTSSSSAL